MADVCNLKDLAQAIQALVTAGGILVGGLWALIRFGVRREAHAKIELELELSVIGRRADLLLVEIAAKVTNKGLVRHWLYDFGFSVRRLAHGDPLTEGDGTINHQIQFEPLLPRRLWLPTDDGSATFVDAGATQRYTYVAAVPEDTEFVLVYTRFRYADESSEYHTSQKVWNLNPG